MLRKPHPLVNKDREGEAGEALGVSREEEDEEMVSSQVVILPNVFSKMVMGVISLIAHRLKLTFK